MITRHDRCGFSAFSASGKEEGGGGRGSNPRRGSGERGGTVFHLKSTDDGLNVDGGEREGKRRGTPFLHSAKGGGEKGTRFREILRNLAQIPFLNTRGEREERSVAAGKREKTKANFGTVNLHS